MFQLLLSFHSLLRWLVIIGLIYSLFRAYKGWFSKKIFSPFDNTIRHTTATIAHFQLIIGLCVYVLSPTIDYFLHHYKDAVHVSEMRFFGMEHSVMMLIAIVLITIGSAKAKRKQTDELKFKTIAIWYTIAFIIILISVPWKFSPMASRPYFRGF